MNAMMGHPVSIKIKRETEEHPTKNTCLIRIIILYFGSRTLFKVGAYGTATVSDAENGAGKPRSNSDKFVGLTKY